MNYLRSALEAGEFFCSAELVLGRDHSVPDVETFVRDAAREPSGIKVISLTDLPGGNPSLLPEAFASFVIEHNLTPLAHLTGKDGNRSLLEARLHALARIGVENILALTGDAPKSAFQGKAKPVFDFDSVLMIQLIQALSQGIEYSVGKRQVRTSPFGFLPGAVVNPFKARQADQMMQLYKLELKIAAGARFIITQLGYNLRKLYELKQYLVKEGLDDIPVVANIYLPTATAGRMMRAGEIAGCIVPDKLQQRLDAEKKPERLERAALMLAAARGLGFAGGHIGGLGISHQDCMWIMDRAATIGADWRGRIEELIFEVADEFYLWPRAADGLSTGKGDYQLVPSKRHLPWKQRVSVLVHEYMIHPESRGARFLSARLKAEQAASSDRHFGFWHAAMGLSTLYRKATLGCISCGDCIQDHLNYVGCTMHHCHKNLRNGPCGGSRMDGTCEADPLLPCIWNRIYQNTVAAGEDPRRYARTLIPPRDWGLDRSNALTNRLIGVDNLGKRVVKSFGQDGRGIQI